MQRLGYFLPLLVLVFFSLLNEVSGFTVARPRVISLVPSRRLFTLSVPGTGLTEVNNVRLRMPSRPDLVDLFYEANGAGSPSPCTSSTEGTLLTCVDIGPYSTPGDVEMMVAVGTNTSDWGLVGRVDSVLYANATQFYVDGSQFIAPLSASFQLTGASGASVSSIACSPVSATSLRCLSANGLPSAGTLSISVFSTGQPPADFIPFTFVGSSRLFASCSPSRSQLSLDPVISASVQHYSVSATNITVGGYGFGVAGSLPSVTLSPAPAAASALATHQNGRVLDLFLTTPAPGLGALMARISINSRESGDFVQVAMLVPDPTLQSSMKGISSRSTVLTIVGENFGDSIAELTVSLSSGSCNPTQIQTGTSLLCQIVSIPRLGSLLVSVSRAGGKQVGATVGVIADPPTVSGNGQNYVDYRSIVFMIRGTNFATQNGSVNRIVFNDGVPCLQLNVSASGDSLFCSVENATLISSISILQVTSFEANGISADLSSPVTVAVLKRPPAPSWSTRSLLFGSNQILHVDGTGFSSVSSENQVEVVLSDNSTRVTCAVVGSTATSVECEPASVWTTYGPVWAQVTSFGLVQETGVVVGGLPGLWNRVGTVRSRPKITASTLKVPIFSPGITIRGEFFSNDPLSANEVQLFQYGATGSCLVTAATEEALVCQPQLANQRVGPLSATVVVDGIAMSATSVVPIQIAELDTVPTIFSNIRAIPLNSTTVTIWGRYFGPLASDNSIELVDSTNTTVAGVLSFANETILVYTLALELEPGQLFVRTISSHGMTNSTLVLVATARPYPRVFAPDQLDYDSTLGPLTTITIVGENFSFDSAEISVELNSGTCRQVLLSTNETIVCAIDGLAIEGGILSCQVTILGGVSSLWQPIFRLWPAIFSAAAPLPINAPFLIIHGFHFSSNLSRLRVELDRFTSCEIVAATSNRLNCSLRDPPDLVGPLQAVIFLRRRDTNLNPMISDTAVVASVVPVLDVLPLKTVRANSTTLTLYGEGFSPRTIYNRIELSPGGYFCAVVSLTSSAVTCSVANSNFHGGVLAAQLAVYAEDVSQWFYAIAPVDVAVIQPVLTVEADQVPIVETPVTITGFGFSDNPSDISVAVRPHGQCVTLSATTTSFNCSLSGSSLGPIYVTVAVRNSTSDEAHLAVIIIPLPGPSALTPTMLAALNAVELGKSPVDRAAPVDGGAYHVQMVAGAILGMIIMILLAFPLIAVIVYVFYLKHRESNSALYRVLLGMTPKRFLPAPAAEKGTSEAKPVQTAEIAASSAQATSPKSVPSPETIRKKQLSNLMKQGGLRRANSDASESEMSRDDDEDVLPDAPDVSDPDNDETESGPDSATPPRGGSDASLDLSFSHNTPAVVSRKDKEPAMPTEDHPSPKRVLFSSEMPHKTEPSDDSDGEEETISGVNFRIATPRFTFTAIQPDDDDDDDSGDDNNGNKENSSAARPDLSLSSGDTLPAVAKPHAEPEETPVSLDEADENFDLPEDDDDDDDREREYLASITRLKQQPTPADPEPVRVVPAVVTSAASTKQAALVPSLAVVPLKTVSVVSAVAASAATAKPAMLVPKLAISTATPLRSAMKRKESVDAPPSDMAKRKVSFFGAANPVEPKVVTIPEQAPMLQQPSPRRLSLGRRSPPPPAASLQQSDTPPEAREPMPSQSIVKKLTFGRRSPPPPSSSETAETPSADSAVITLDEDNFAGDSSATAPSALADDEDIL